MKHRETSHVSGVVLGAVGGVEVETLKLGRRFVVRSIRGVEVEAEFFGVDGDGDFDVDRSDDALDVGIREIDDSILTESVETTHVLHHVEGAVVSISEEALSAYESTFVKVVDLGESVEGAYEFVLGGEVVECTVA